MIFFGCSDSFSAHNLEDCEQWRNYIWQYAIKITGVTLMVIMFEIMSPIIMVLCVLILMVPVKPWLTPPPRRSAAVAVSASNEPRPPPTKPGKVLGRCRMECEGLDMICIKDQTLTIESAEKVIGWALSHHLMQNPESNVDSGLVLCSESIRYGIGILPAIQNKSKSLKKSLKDVVTENEFEKRLLADVIPPSDIGVTFDDIGALENVKDTLKELVRLPLQRPELFCKGQLTKACKGILLFALPKRLIGSLGSHTIVIRKPTEKAPFFGKHIPQRPPVASRNILNDGEARSRYKKHPETFEKELVMTSNQADLKNKMLPKGYAYVPSNSIPKDKWVSQDGSSEPLEDGG
ncbi:hypothetical protein NL676_012278 [Syzygium grande]|nr:hypothetical protein NL676_012278 [Syzygium grande]